MGKTGLYQFSWISPSRRGYGAVASTSRSQRHHPQRRGETSPRSRSWAHTGGELGCATWVSCPLGLALIFSLIAWIRLQRLGPRRRKG